jgi:L-glyceraldehyde 3-phosphate reductase
MGLEYVDIFYSHRRDHDTPLEETIGALDTAVRQGKALYVGISSYGAESTDAAGEIARDLHTPLLIHQPAYNMFYRWIEEEGVLDACERNGLGVIAFSPLAQGLLTDRYLQGVPEGSRASRNDSLSRDSIDESTLQKIRALNDIATRRGQSLAQLALAWILRDRRVTSALIGASSVEQLETNVGTLDRLEIEDDELAAIERALGAA